MILYFIHKDRRVAINTTRRTYTTMFEPTAHQCIAVTVPYFLALVILRSLPA